MLIVYKSISKLVTPDPRLQGCIVLYNISGDSAGESILYNIPVFVLILNLSVISFILLLIYNVAFP